MRQTKRNPEQELQNFSYYIDKKFASPTNFYTDELDFFYTGGSKSCENPEMKLSNELEILITSRVSYFHAHNV